MHNAGKKKTIPNLLGAGILEAFTTSGGLVSVAVVLLGFLVATVLILLVGRNPAGMYQAILQVLSGWDLRRGTHNFRYVG